MRVSLRPSEAGDQSPLVRRFVTEPRRVNSVAISVWLHLCEEPIRLASLPRVNEITLPARAFISELTNVNLRTASKRNDSLLLRNVARVVRLEGAPHRKKDATLFRAIHLKPEVALPEAVGHVKSTDRILTLRNGDL